MLSKPSQLNLFFILSTPIKIRKENEIRKNNFN